MISICNEKDEKRIFSYIGTEYPSCLYLFLNLKKYGFNSETIAVYIQQEEDKTKAVLLKYYSCLHVYSRNNAFDAVELGCFISNNSFSMIYCAADTAQKIISGLSNSIRDRINVTSGWVAQIERVDKKAQGVSVLAQESDFEQIARLIFEDEDIGRSYQYNELAQQLKERNRDGYARNIVIKQGDLVIAHACTNAEVDNIAVVAELLVRKEYRRKGYASEIWRDLCGKLLSEGKEVYSFYYSTESRNLHKHIGFSEVCAWTKIIIS